eukprot:516617-Amphidinium_carterae.2
MTVYGYETSLYAEVFDDHDQDYNGTINAIALLAGAPCTFYSIDCPLPRPQTTNNENGCRWHYRLYKFGLQDSGSAYLPPSVLQWLVPLF